MCRFTRSRLLIVCAMPIASVLLGGRWLPAADPVLNAIEPYGFQRGTEVVVQFTGARLGDAEELLWYRPGIRLADVQPADPSVAARFRAGMLMLSAHLVGLHPVAYGADVFGSVATTHELLDDSTSAQGGAVAKGIAVDDNRVQVRLAIAPDCPLGFHGVRVRTATGISNLLTFSVGALPEVQEQEPNDDFGSPQVIESGCTVNGVVKNEDVDYYAVHAKQGERISVELEGVRLGMPPGNATFFDPFVAILNQDRFELARCDDAPLLQQDSLCAIIAPADGTYVIEVRESAYGGSDLCKYRLHVGPFPRPTAVLPSGGRPGETLEVKWLGDPGGEWVSSVTLPTTGSDAFALLPQDDRGVAPSPLYIRVNDLPNVLEVEPNDAFDKATPFTAPAALNGVVSQPGDVDHFRFPAKKGQVYDVRVFARRPMRSPLDAVLTIARSNGAGVAGNDDSGGPDSYLRFTAPEDDDYVVIVRDQLSDGAPDFVYRIELAPVVPSLTLSLPERIQYVPVTASVPRNNRMAFMLNAARANFGGDLDITMEGLPAGVTTEPIKMSADLSSIPVLLTASGDAPNGGSLVDLIGRPTDPNLAVVGHLQQRTMLVRGQNNIDVWGHDADRMAVAVTQEAPFSVQIVQPQVPIVRDGAMDLKVVATRKEGYNEPIAIYLLYNPPGIGSSGSISIPAGQTEATIPLTANGSAAIGTWPIIVLARGKAGNGDIDLASPVANLEISDRFFTFAFEKAAAELGQQADVLVRIQKQRDFEGTATAQLLGLPAKTAVDSQPLEFTKDTSDVVFQVKIEPDARPGRYQGLVCRAIVTINGEPIVHTLGAGELRVDQPLPPKADAPAAAPPPQPAPQEAAPKRLSRLEQLRLDRQRQQNQEDGK